MRLYFSESERRKYWFRLRLVSYAIFLFIGAAAIGAVYVARETPVFWLTRVDVLGIPQSERSAFIGALEPFIYKNASARFLGIDNFLAWPNELPVLGPDMSGIEVQKDFLERSVTLHVSRRERFGIWCFQFSEANTIAGEPEIAAIDSECFWTDEDDGILFEEAPLAAGQLFITVFENTDVSTSTPSARPALGGAVLDSIRFGRLKRVLEVSSGLGLTGDRVEFNREGDSVSFKTHEGPVLKYSLRFDFDESSVNALKELFSKKAPEAIRYADLTVKNKIYVR